jgi:hypothetical protein
MAVAFRAASFTNIGNTTPNPGEPTGTASGDILVAIALVDTTSTILTRPTGWTNLVSGLVSGKFRYDVSYIVRGGSAAATTYTL